MVTCHGGPGLLKKRLEGCLAFKAFFYMFCCLWMFSETLFPSSR